MDTSIMNEDYSVVILAYKQAFERTNGNDLKLMFKIANNLYDALDMQYDYCEYYKDKKQQYRICQLIDEDVLDKIANAISSCRDTKMANRMYELHRKFMALSARRNLKNFALFIESGKTKKVWDKTLDTVRSVFYYADLFGVSDKLNLFRVSMMPSMGKSYIANLFVAQSCGNDPNIQILRITYSDDLCQTTTEQTEAIIDSDEFREIFPRYKGISKIFKTQTKYQFCMIDSDDAYNLNASTRDGQSTGLRADILLIDDPLKDDSESYNVALHKKILDRYESTWTSRAGNDKLKIFLMGTMWANTDLLNVIYDRYCESDTVIQSAKFKWTEVTKSGSAVFIGVPALDENDESTCPLRYSTAKLKEKRKNMTKFLWQAVYQQNPIAPEGLEFDYSNLKLYDVKPSYTGTRYATLDPARRGKNYVSMPVLYALPAANEKNQFALMDFLYRKKSMKELYDPIADKVVEHRLNYLLIENNTDTSLKVVLEEKIRQRGYYNCLIEEVYSTKNKEQRIKDNQGSVRGNIIYPRKGLYPPNSDMGKAMEAITSYSFEYPNKYDDAIDSIVLFTMNYIEKEYKFEEVGTFKR